jgi:MATE family multidrug resistance protein
MLTPERVKTISKLALPFTVALSSTLVLALIDLGMVGTLGNTAVAAVGVSTFCYTLVVAFVVGIAPAVQGIVARRRGEGFSGPKCLPLNAGLLMALIVGTPLAILCSLFSPFLISLISSDAGVIAAAVPYLSTLYFGILAAGINSAFRGYWAGMEKPRMYMSIVLLMSAMNILLNYVFIFGHFGAPALGVRGAAIGTVSALYIGVATNCTIAYLMLRREGFLSAKPDTTLVKRVVKLGLPATMQEFLFSAGYITFFWMVGRVGTAELAAANVLVRVTLVLVILATALGMASATLVSRTVGEGNLAGAAQWGWDAGKMGIISITLLGLPLLVFPERFLSLFLTDPATVAIAILPLRLVAATAGIGSLVYIFGYTLYSVGDGNRVVMVSFGTQWIFFLPVVWFVGPHLHAGLLQIWMVQMVYGLLATALITAIWVDGRWKRVKF